MSEKNTNSSKKKRGAIIAAAVIILLLIIWDLFFIILRSIDSIPLPIMLYFTVPPIIVIIGIVVALKSRIKEIKGGEEDDSVNY